MLCVVSRRAGKIVEGDEFQRERGQGEEGGVREGGGSGVGGDDERGEVKHVSDGVCLSVAVVYEYEVYDGWCMLCMVVL